MAALASLARPIGTPLLVGDGEPVRVMALVGTTSKADERKEPSKVEQLAQLSSPPDVIADLVSAIRDILYGGAFWRSDCRPRRFPSTPSVGEIGALIDQLCWSDPSSTWREAWEWSRSTLRREETSFSLPKSGRCLGRHVEEGW